MSLQVGGRPGGVNYDFSLPKSDKTYPPGDRSYLELRRFFLMTADFSLKGTPFEGGSLTENLQHFRALLDQNETSFAALGLDVPLIKKTLSTTEPFCRLFNPLSPADIARFVAGLQVGESFLIPSGWGGYQSSHAVLIQLTKKAEGSFSCTIFNTGAGIDQHDAFIEEGKEKFANALIVENIKPFKLNGSFFDFLIKIKNTHQDPSIIYETMLRYLEGSKGRQELNGKLLFKTSQRSGSCSWKCIMSFLRQNCKDYQTYRKVKHFIIAKELQNSAPLLKSLEKQSIEEITEFLAVYKKGVEKFARSVDKSFDQEYLSAEERASYLKLIEQIYLLLGAAEKRLLDQHDFVVVDKITKASLSQKEESVEEGDKKKPLIKPMYGQERFLIDAIDIRLETQQEISAAVHQLASIRETYLSQDWIVYFIQKLPLPQSPIWAGFNDKQIEEFSSDLFCCLNKIRLSPFQGSDLILSANYHVLGIVDRLRKQHSESQFQKELELDIFNISELKLLSTIALSKKDLSYRQEVFSYFNFNPMTPREKKLFYFLSYSRYGLSYSALSKDLDKTPFEQFLKRKMNPFARIKDVIQKLHLHLTPIDLRFFQIFLSCSQMVNKILGDENIEDRRCFKLETFLAPSYEDAGFSYIFSGSFAPDQKRELTEIESDRLSDQDELRNTRYLKDSSEKRMMTISEKMGFYHEFLMSTDLEDMDFRILGFFSDDFARLLNKQSAVSFLLSFIYSERFYKIVATNPIFRELFYKKFKSFFEHAILGKEFDNALLLFVSLAKGEWVSHQLSQESVCQLDLFLDELRKIARPHELNLIYVLEALMLKNKTEEEFALRDLATLLKASYLVANTHFSDKKEVKIPLISLMRSEILSLKVRFETKARTLLAELAQDELSELLNRAFFSEFEKGEVKWSVGRERFEFLIEGSLIKLTYYNDLIFEKVAEIEANFLLPKKELTFQDGYFYHKKTGVRFYCESEYQLSFEKFFEGSWLCLSTSLRGSTFEKELISEHGPLTYQGFFEKKLGSRSLQYFVFDSGKKIIKILFEGYSRKRKSELNVDREFFGRTYYQVDLDPSFNLNLPRSISYSLWESETDMILETKKPHKVLQLSKEGLFLDPHRSHIQLAKPHLLLFSGFTNYLYMADTIEGSAEAHLHLPSFGDHTLLISSNEEFIIATETDKGVLSWIFFKAMDYEKAYHWILRTQTIGKLSEPIIKLFLSILSFSNNHPDALVCKMKIASLLIQNAHLYKKELTAQEELPRDFLDQIGKVYVDYIDQLGRGRLPPLKAEEELLLWIPKSYQNPSLLQRKEQLDGKSLTFLKLKKPSLGKKVITSIYNHPFYNHSQSSIYPDPNYNISNPLTPAHFFQIFLDIKSARNLETIKLLILTKKGTFGDAEKNQAYVIENLLRQKHLPDLRAKSLPLYSDDIKMILETSLLREDLEDESFDDESFTNYSISSKKTSQATSARVRLKEDSALTCDLQSPPVPSDSFQELHRQKRVLSDFIDTQIQKIRSIAALLPEEPLERDMIALKRAAGVDIVPSFEDLLALFALGSRQGYLDRTYLNPEGAQHLHDLIANYLEAKLRLSQVEKSIDLIGELKEGELDQEPILAQLDLLKQRERIYDPALYPEFLLFEALEGISIKRGQLESLLRLKEDPSALIHMIMGAGKSKVITPIWAFMVIKYHKKVPFIVVPSALYPTGKEMAKESIFKSFGKFGHGFEFSRETPSEVNDLKILLRALELAKEEKGFIYTTKESLLSFLLANLDLYHALEKEDQAVTLERIEISNRILAFLKQECIALFDEVHSLLNIKEEVNFTIGAALPLNVDEALFVKELVLELSEIKELGLQEDKQAQLSHEEYERVVKTRVLEFLLRKFPDVGQEYFLEKTVEIPAKLGKDQDLIALGKEMVTRLIPHTLTKKANEHYGLRKGSFVAIPFIANNTPNPKSEFGSPYETLLYTLYYYCQKPIADEVFKLHIEKLLDIAKSQMVQDESILDETSTGREFFSKYQIRLSSPKVAKELSQIINASLLSKLEFALISIVFDIKSYPLKLSANARDLHQMFHGVQMMSGTPWNYESYANGLEAYLDFEIDRKSGAIIERVPETAFHSFKTDSDSETFSALLKKLKEHTYHALIDSGALIKGHPSEKVAEAILEITPFKGVVYYDENDELYVLLQNREKVPFDKCQLKKEERFTFYDQRHTTGSDIQQASSACALVTFSETTLLFELFQSMWRMRGLEKGQTIHLIFDEALFKLFDQEAKSPSEKLLSLALANQQKKVLENNFRSIKAQIKTIATFAIKEALRKAPKEKMKETFDLVKSFLQIHTAKTAYELFGTIPTLAPSLDLIEKWKKMWITILEDLESKQILEASASVYQIQNLTLPRLPEYHLWHQHDLDSEVENEIERQEHEQNQEVELEVHVGHQSVVRKEPLQQRVEWVEETSLFELPAAKQALCEAVGNESMHRKMCGPQHLLFKILFPDTHVFRLEDVIGNSTSNIPAPFNPNISISYNFLLPYQTKSLFDGIGKPVYHILVMLHETGQVETMIIDQLDLSYFRNKLQEDTGMSEKRVALYSPGLGITHVGKKRISQEELVRNQEFTEQLAQIKFFAGLSRYSEKELAFLENWLKINPQQMFDLFIRLIACNPMLQKSYKSSALETLFKKLFAKQD